MIFALLFDLHTILAMSYTKKKPYKHKGNAAPMKKKYGSDSKMLSSNNDGKASSTDYKNHIDGA